MRTETRIYEYLTRLSRLLQSEERATEAMVPVQLQALLYLTHCNRYSDTPSAVAEYLGITKGTASQTLLALERGGFLRKEADPDDGRSVRLRLTAHGRRVTSARALPPSLAESLGAMSARELERLHDELFRLLSAIQRAGRGRSFGVCHSCRHFTKASKNRYLCGLTGEPLLVAETEQICREHEPLTV